MCAHVHAVCHRHKSTGLCGERLVLHFPVIAKSYFLTVFGKILFLFASFLLISFVSGVASFIFDYLFSNYFLNSGYK